MPRKSTEMRRPRPGPKSKQKQVSKLMGEDSSAVSDDEEFQSPELHVDDTDYDLQYTTSQVVQDDERPSTSRQARQSYRQLEDTHSQSRERNSRLYERGRDTAAATLQSPESSPSRSDSSQVVVDDAVQSPENHPSRSGRSQVVAAPISKRTRKQKEPQKRNFVKEYKQLLKRTDNMIPRLPFSRLIRELLISLSTEANRITLPALIALQEASEAYLTQMFQDSYACSLHRGRVTLNVRDMQLVRYLRGPSQPSPL